MVTPADLRREFDSVIVADFEFAQPDGCNPLPSALCWREMFTGKEGRHRGDEMLRMTRPPFPVGRRDLLVAHYLPAELGCMVALGWQLPQRLLDTWTAEKVRRFGKGGQYGFGLLQCLDGYGLPTRETTEKKAMQALGAEGGPTSEEQWGPFLEYCMDDVNDCQRLLEAQLHHIDLPRELIRGRYMAAVARMESVGIPIDVPLLGHMREQWGSIQTKLIDTVNPRYNVYVDGSFNVKAFEAYLHRTNTPWPRLPTGHLDLQDDTFRSMAKAHPHVAELRETRHALGQTRLFTGLTVGPDGRNRTGLRPFASRTGRNQPSNAKFLFGTARAIRSLCQPREGWGVAYCDFSSQEFLIGAALSGDRAMLDTYHSGDVYLGFAKQAGAVPADATKQSHPNERANFKAACLAVQYGMGSRSLAARIGCPDAEARDLLQLHREAYPTFWKWSDGAVDEAMLWGQLSTNFGWTVHVPPADVFGKAQANPRSLANFPCQAHGAEMLRMACCLLTEAGIRVCCPVHDAVMVEAPLDQLDETVATTRELMQQASAIVLGGERCRVDADVVRYPDHYVDEAGAEFWQTLLQLAGPMPPQPHTM